MAKVSSGAFSAPILEALGIDPDLMYSLQIDVKVGEAVKVTVELFGTDALGKVVEKEIKRYQWVEEST